MVFSIKIVVDEMEWVDGELKEIVEIIVVFMMGIVIVLFFLCGFFCLICLLCCFIFFFWNSLKWILVMRFLKSCVFFLVLLI